MVRYGLNILLFVLVVGIAVAGWAIDRNLSQPNFESIVEGQMGRSPAYDSFAPNPNFPDGSTMRQPPAGTVIRGQRPLHYQATPEDALRAGLELRNPFDDSDTKRELRGRTAYENFCRVCHGPLGLGAGPVTQGGFPPPPSLLTDRALRMPDGQMFHILTYGQGNMPSTAAQLSEEDRWSAILHVRYLQKLQAPYRSPVPVTLQSIAAVFKQNCSMCHGDDGSGNLMRKVLPNIPNFTSLAWQVSQTEMAIVNQIDYGSQPLMPSFRYKLTREEIQGLAVYVRSFPGRPGEAAKQTTVVAGMSPVTVYQNLCFSCHDTSGRGVADMRKGMPELPDFTSAAWQTARSDQDLGHSIIEGKGKFMLPMKAVLGTVDVKDMVALVRKFKDGKQVIPLAKEGGPGVPPPITPLTPKDLESIKVSAKDLAKDKEPPPAIPTDLAPRIARGATIFRQLCITCHGPDGKGMPQMRLAMPSLPDFTDAGWQQQKENAELQASILLGKGAFMPAWQASKDSPLSSDQAHDLVAYVRGFGPATLVKGRASDSEFTKNFLRLQQQYDELERQLQTLRSQRP
jgi:mono/diheme cytochrome c family protein